MSSTGSEAKSDPSFLTFEIEDGSGEDHTENHVEEPSDQTSNNQPIQEDIEQKAFAEPKITYIICRLDTLGYQKNEEEHLS